MNTPENLISPDLQRFYEICEQHGWKQEKIDAAARFIDNREIPRDWTIKKKGPLFTYVLEHYPFSNIGLALDALDALGRVDAKAREGQVHTNIEQLMMNQPENKDNSYVARIAELQHIQQAVKAYDSFIKVCEISHTIHEPKTERRGNRLQSVVHPLYTMSKQIEAFGNSEELDNSIATLHNILQEIRQYLPTVTQKNPPIEEADIAKVTEVTVHTPWTQLVNTLQTIATESDTCAEIFKSSNAAVLKLVKRFLEEITALQRMIAASSKDVVVIENIFPSFSNNEDKAARNAILREIDSIRNLLDSPTKFIVAVKAHLHNYDTEKKSNKAQLPQVPQMVQNIARNTLVQIMSVIVAIGAVSISYKALTSSKSTDAPSAVAKNDALPTQIETIDSTLEENSTIATSSAVANNDSLLTEPVEKSGVTKEIVEEDLAEKERKMAQFQAMAADLQDSLKKQTVTPEAKQAPQQPGRLDSIDVLFGAATGYKADESESTKAPENITAANLPPVTLSQDKNSEPPYVAEVSDANSVSSETTTDVFTDILDNEPKTEAEKAAAEKQRKRYAEIEANEKAAQEQRARAFAEKEQAEKDRLAKAATTLEEKGSTERPKNASGLPPITLSTPKADVSLAESPSSQGAAELPAVATDAEMISSAPKPGAMIIEESELTELMQNKSSTDTQKDTIQPLIAQNPRIAFERLATTTPESTRVEVARTPSRIAAHSVLNIPMPEVHISSAVIAKATFEPILPEITDHEPLPRRTFILPEIEHTVIILPKAKTPDTVTANNSKDSSTTNTTQNTTVEKPSIDIEKMTEEQFLLLSTEEQNKVLEQLRALRKAKQRK